MKKHFTFKTVIAGTMIATLLFSMSAIASENASTPSETTPTVKAENMTATEADQTPDTLYSYGLVKGTVSSIEKDGVYTKIQIDNDNMRMIFTVENKVFVIDQNDSSYKSLEDLKKGMEITAVLSNNSIMTMSTSPMIQGAAGFIINDKNSFMDLSDYGEDLTNNENTLKLNIDDKTTIVDMKGSKKVFSQEDLKNNLLLVLYGASTRSIPAQTSPSLVMILDSADGTPVTLPELEESMPIETPATATQPASMVKPEQVSLR